MTKKGQQTVMMLAPSCLLLLSVSHWDLTLHLFVPHPNQSRSPLTRHLSRRTLVMMILRAYQRSPRRRGEMKYHHSANNWATHWGVQNRKSHSSAHFLGTKRPLPLPLCRASLKPLPLPSLCQATWQATWHQHTSTSFYIFLKADAGWLPGSGECFCNEIV